MDLRSITKCRSNQEILAKYPNPLSSRSILTYPVRGLTRREVTSSSDAAGRLPWWSISGSGGCQRRASAVEFLSGGGGWGFGGKELGLHYGVGAASRAQFIVTLHAEHSKRRYPFTAWVAVSIPTRVDETFCLPGINVCGKPRCPVFIPFGLRPVDF